MLVGGHFALLYPGVFRQGNFGVEAIALPGLCLFLFRRGQGQPDASGAEEYQDGIDNVSGPLPFLFFSQRLAAFLERRQFQQRPEFSDVHFHVCFPLVLFRSFF